MSIKGLAMTNPTAIHTNGLDIQKVYHNNNLIWDKSGTVIPLVPLPTSLDFQVASDTSTFDFSDGNITKVYCNGVAMYQPFGSYKSAMLVDQGLPKQVLEIGTHISAYPYLNVIPYIDKPKTTIFILAKMEITSGHVISKIGINNILMQSSTIKRLALNQIIIDWELLEGTLNGWILYVVYAYNSGLSTIGGNNSTSKQWIAECLQYSRHLSDYEIALNKAYLKNKWFGSNIKTVNESLSKVASSYKNKDIMVDGTCLTISNGTVTQANNGGFKDYYFSVADAINPVYTPFKAGYLPKVGILNGYNTMIFDNKSTTTVNDAICMNDKAAKNFTAGTRIMYAVFKVASGIPTGYLMPIFGAYDGASTSIDALNYDTTTKGVKVKTSVLTHNGSFSCRIYHKDPVKTFEDWTIVAFSFDYNMVYRYTNIGLSVAKTGFIWLMGEIAEVGCFFGTPNDGEFNNDLLLSLRDKYKI